MGTPHAVGISFAGRQTDGQTDRQAKTEGDETKNVLHAPRGNRTRATPCGAGDTAGVDRQDADGERERER